MSALIDNHQQSKLYSFNAGSFRLGEPVVALLKSKGAISLDFGSAAYIDSEAIPAIISELVEKANSAPEKCNHEQLIADLKHELARSIEERENIANENVRLSFDLKAGILEIQSLKTQLEDCKKVIANLNEAARHVNTARVEQATEAAKAAPQSAGVTQADEKVKKELQQLRHEHVEAIASLKVLEDENEELRNEIEALKAQLKNTAPAVEQKR